MTSSSVINVVGIGGSLRAGSHSERALHIALDGAAEAGARTQAITGSSLVLPFYDTAVTERTPEAEYLVETIRQADGIVIVSPGYHGALSGLVKNALDYIEDLRPDERPYLDGRGVGLVAVAYGWQAAVTTLDQLRTITHALRGWPTPLGGAVNTAEVSFDEAGGATDEKTVTTLRLIGRQVTEFALKRG
ncbi:MAG TPA: NAD(P)H-dependent oxidoreductase [Amycolatopsis sp.]|nr:NAD(P)H-dependent oxidoreductase [Amycolatopsis sp.]